jgi:S1-C subfamily serine protease
LVNDEGLVIGVPTAIESPVRANAGIGFAVPAAIVQQVVPALIRDGEYEHAWLGISGTSLNSQLAEAMDLASDQAGVLVAEVIRNTPADEAGLQGGDQLVDVNGQQVQIGGDVITAVDGKTVSRFEDLRAILQQAEPGQEVELTLLRDGDETTVGVTLGERPALTP